MAVTIYDVARTAGVGIGTVSRVLNNSEKVKDTTRQKVLEAIEQLNFKPDPIARSMSLGRTNSIGIIVPFFTRPFFIEVLKGVQAATMLPGLDLVLFDVKNNYQRDHYFTQLPMRRKVDGLLVISLSPDEAAVARFHEANLPTVLVDAYHPQLTSIVVNNVDGSYRAVKALIEKGHRRIGFINGVIEGNFKFNQANDRLIGLHRAFGEVNIEFEPELVLATDWSRQGGKQAALQFLNLPHPPTAIFAASDIQAFGVLEAVRSLKLRVPEDVAVMGYDGIELAELLDLSTVQQPMHLMGELAVGRLIEHISNPHRPPELIRLDTTLQERHTTGRP